MSRLHRLRPLSALAGVLLAAACGDDELRQDEFLPSVSAARVERVSLEQEIRASGDLEARLHTRIAAEIEGRITGIAAEEGSSVDRGAVVLEIDPERRNLELAAAKARLAQARARYAKERRQTERVRKLGQEDIASQQQLDEAEAALELARAEVAAARADVGVAERARADASVAAPFAGRVARRHVELGEFVQPGKALFELVALDPLEVVFSLTELDTERVREGQPVEIEVGAFPERRFRGVVRFVAPTVDPATRTLRIKAEVANTERLLRPGLFARVSLGTDRREGVLMVPEEALVQREEGAQLFRIGPDERVELLHVRTGAAQDGRVEVRGEIEAGDLIVRRGHGGLADGAQVVVVEGPRASLAAKEDPAAGPTGAAEL